MGSNISDKELKQQLVEITTELYMAGVITAAGGNISVRCATLQDAAWITPSQIFKRDLKPDDLVLIDFDGRKLKGNGKPSVESAYHGGIFRNRSDVNAVVHSHAPLATVFGLGDMEMLPITPEAVSLLNYPIIPWYLGGTKELAFAVIEQLGCTKAQGAFLRNHGLITLGEDLRKAADRTLLVEHTVKILLICRASGLEPTLIPDDVVRFLSNSETVL